MRGDQRALMARARKSSRLAEMVFRPTCWSCAGRSFVGFIVLVSEFIVGLQIVRDDIERFEFRVPAEIHRDRSGVLPGTLSSAQDRKSTRLNSSHRTISYAVFCLKKKKGDGTRTGGQTS